MRRRIVAKRQVAKPAGFPASTKVVPKLEKTVKVAKLRQRLKCTEPGNIKVVKAKMANKVICLLGLFDFGLVPKCKRWGLRYLRDGGLSEAFQM